MECLQLDFMMIQWIHLQDKRLFFLIPKSNPFLRGLFNYVSGAECDDRIIWIIDSLAEYF